MKKITIAALLLFTSLSFGQALVEDTTFNMGTGFTNWSGFGSVTVNKATLQPDGKILVAGQYINYNGNAVNCIVRLNSNGTLDNTFTPGTGTNAGIWGCKVLSDGKILIHGGFTAYNGVASNRIVRLNANGTKDTSFAIGTGPSDYVETAVVQPDGKMILGGRFTSYNGTAVNRICRINANGTLDNTFTVGVGANERIREVALQPDGKIIVVGDFTEYSGVTVGRIVRLNANGSVDTTFNSGGSGALSKIWTVKLQPDNKILIGGEFQAYNGTAAKRIARLNTNGLLENAAFNTANAANSTVMTIFVENNGQIIIGGSFNAYGNVGRSNFARINADATLDTSFTIGTGFDNWVNSIERQTDGKLLLGGNFTTFDGNAKNRIIRFTSGTMGNEQFDIASIAVYPNPATDNLSVSNIEAIGDYTITDLNGRIVEQNTAKGNSIGVSSLRSGIYLLSFTKDGRAVTQKFIRN
ncbi:T9SS type A sorting domain-containing protein [Flavobacterium sp.]|uniref:T9SS type A sorting domain-containing protein n=1 Tax=Flavobacterium sp. TaxID=239 RepID=UPI004034C7EE